MPGPRMPTVSRRLEIRPLAFRDACDLVDALRRHRARPVGHQFSIGALDQTGRQLGATMVGRPVASHLDDGLTLEVTRLVTDASRNCCSMLLSAAWQAARAFGYLRLITNTHADESGASLRAAGWTKVRKLPPRRGWSTPTRPRRDRGTDEVARSLWRAPSPRRAENRAETAAASQTSPPTGATVSRSHTEADGRIDELPAIKDPTR